MRLHRFYTTEVLTPTLTYTNVLHLHQWRNVFRYEVGDSVILFGDSFEHTYEIESIDKKSALLKEVSISPSKTQEKKFGLALALIKKDNFELVLEKCTELGVTDFYPFVSERSLHKMYSTERLEKILVEATEQSGWGSVPTLHTVQTFEELLSGNKCTVFDMSGEKISTDSFKSEEEIVCIGPEGGYSENELALAKTKKATILSLPTGVLRAETAAIAVTSITLLQ